MRRVKQAFRFSSILMSLLLCFPLLGGKLPELAQTDVTTILHQMMDGHATYKSLSPQLMQRAICCFIDELDPAKTYLLSSELTPWLTLSERELEDLTHQVADGDYTPFFAIHRLMLTAIERRKHLEQAIEEIPPLAHVSTTEFKEIPWAQSDTELRERLFKLHTLQAQAAAKLDATTREKAFARIAKRRASKEEEIRGTEPFVLCTTLKAFATAMDTHTCYFTPAEAAQFMVQVQQRLFGIGAQLRDDLNGFTIVKMIEGGPATRGTGLKNGDRIIAINGEPVVGLEITDAVELIRGEEGTVVELTILREQDDGSEERHEIPIQRGEVVIQEARIASKTLPFGDGVIAVIALHSFYQDPNHSSGADLYDAIMNIKKEHKVKGMVLDLRDNSGGVLPQAVAVTGLFITKGIVVSIKDHLGTVEHLREIDGKMAYDGPLIVLTSKMSASAAEIVAQTLQDYGRALIVGDEHTFGKGTFQTFTLDANTTPKINPKGEMKITRGRYYTVSGKSPQLVGVLPDIVVPGLFAHAEIGERHGKYPLETDTIAENFHDDLADIPPMQRDNISWLYRFNLQPKLKVYTRCLPLLQQNSQERLAADPAYQQFLTALEEETLSDEQMHLYLLDDLQLKETLNVMKDLVLLLN